MYIKSVFTSDLNEKYSLWKLFYIMYLKILQYFLVGSIFSFKIRIQIISSKIFYTLCLREKYINQVLIELINTDLQLKPASWGFLNISKLLTEIYNPSLYKSVA